MAHNDLSNYYKTVYNMNKYHNFSPEVIENMIPFERDLYQEMILEDLEKEAAAAQKQAGAVQAFTPAGDRLKI